MRSDHTSACDDEQNGRHHDSDRSEDCQTDEGSSEAGNAAEGPMSDDQLAEILSKKRIRSAIIQC